MIHFNKKTIAVSTVALAIAGGVAAYAWSADTTGGSSAAAATVEAVHFSGPDIVGLWPDKPQPLHLSYTSDNGGDVDVILEPRVTEVLKDGVPVPGCPANTFQFTPDIQHVTLPPQDTPKLVTKVGVPDPEITMINGPSDEAPEACQGVSVVISYAPAP